MGRFGNDKWWYDRSYQYVYTSELKGSRLIEVLFYLIKSRESVFHQEKGIYHKLVVLILETM